MFKDHIFRFVRRALHGWEAVDIRVKWAQYMCFFFFVMFENHIFLFVSRAFHDRRIECGLV